MAFRHTVVVQDEAVVAGTVVSYDLPVAPLSLLYLTLRFLEVTALPTWANIVAMIARLEVLYKGQAVHSYSLADLAASQFLCFGELPVTCNFAHVDNAVMSMGFIVPFGRKHYGVKEAFPRTLRGELNLQLTYAGAIADPDNLILQVEAVELPDATPDSFLKMTTLTHTPAAVGQTDISLPIGNKLSDLVLFGTTVPAGIVATTTIQDVQIRKNNAEEIYTKSNFETLMAMGCLRCSEPQLRGVFGIIEKYLRVPFDVYHDDTNLFDTAGANSLDLRITAGAANAIRVVPLEVVAVGGRGA